MELEGKYYYKKRHIWKAEQSKGEKLFNINNKSMYTNLMYTKTNTYMDRTAKHLCFRSLSRHWFNQNIFQEVNLFTPIKILPLRTQVYHFLSREI